ncbi:hypothetical protein [Sessilibacter sp. MAH2]
MTNKDSHISDDLLDAKLAQLKSRRLEPSTDLWPEIHAKLPIKQQVAWWAKPQLAVAASFLVCAISLIYSLQVSQINESLSTELAEIKSAPATVNNSFISPVSYTEIESCSENTQEQVVIRENLAIIEMALAQIRNALKEAPDDPSLNKKLLDLSKQQINLVNRANTIAL